MSCSKAGQFGADTLNLTLQRDVIGLSRYGVVDLSASKGGEPGDVGSAFVSISEVLPGLCAVPVRILLTIMAPTTPAAAQTPLITQ